MPRSRAHRERTKAAAHRGGHLRVFSVDNSPLDALAMAKLISAIATERQAELDGRPAPHLAGRDKLAELRPPEAPAAPHGPTDEEVHDA